MFLDVTKHNMIKLSEIAEMISASIPVTTLTRKYFNTGKVNSLKHATSV